MPDEITIPSVTPPVVTPVSVTPTDNSTTIPTKTEVPNVPTQPATPPSVSANLQEKENPDYATLQRRIDELERKYGEQQQAKTQTAIKADEPPKPSHTWFRNPFVAG